MRTREYYDTINKETKKKEKMETKNFAEVRVCQYWRRIEKNSRKH